MVSGVKCSSMNTKTSKRVFILRPRPKLGYVIAWRRKAQSVQTLTNKKTRWFPGVCLTPATGKIKQKSSIFSLRIKIVNHANLRNFQTQQLGWPLRTISMGRLFLNDCHQSWTHGKTGKSPPPWPASRGLSSWVCPISRFPRSLGILWQCDWETQTSWKRCRPSHG